MGMIHDHTAALLALDTLILRFSSQVHASLLVSSTTSPVSVVARCGPFTPLPPLPLPGPMLVARTNKINKGGPVEWSGQVQSSLAGQFSRRAQMDKSATRY